MHNFAPLLAEPDTKLNPEQYLLIHAAQRYLVDEFQGRMPVYSGGWFLHAGVDPWPYRCWPSETARTLFKQNWLVADHPSDVVEAKARYVRLNLQRCCYEYIDGSLYFRVGSAIFDTEYTRYDASEMLIALGQI